MLENEKQETPPAETAVQSTRPEKAPATDKPTNSTAIPEGLKVELSKVVFESLYEHNSRSVGLIQIRLIELGYMSAGADKRGWLSTGTRDALEELAKKKKTGDYDSEETISAVFKGTPVTLIP